MQRMGSAVLLQDTALLEVRHLLALGVREREQRNAVPPSHNVRLLLAMLTDAIAEMELVSPPRQQTGCSADTPRQRDSDDQLDWSDLQGQRRIGSREAARMLRTSQRTVQRAASSLGGRRGPDGRLTFDVDLIVEYAATRDKGRMNHV